MLVKTEVLRQLYNFTDLVVTEAKKRMCEGVTVWLVSVFVYMLCCHACCIFRHSLYMLRAVTVNIAEDRCRHNTGEPAEPRAMMCAERPAMYFF